MSAIVNGKFIKGMRTQGMKVNSQHKAYKHDMQRLDHKKDLIQPYKDGHANPEFIQSYPEESQKYYSQDDIQRYGNG